MNIIEFIGKLHPLLVHLPIGVFILALIMEFMIRIPRFAAIGNAIKFIMLIGIISAILSLITGYLLSLEESNNESGVDLHKWIAIATTALFIVYYFTRGYVIEKKLAHLSSVTALFFMLTITGHLGGNLTHGEGYLTLGSGTKKADTVAVVQIANIDEAVVYTDIVQHTLNQKCVQCHGEQRQKGKLRLDNQEWILAGGKNGDVINTKNLDRSELLARLYLDMNDEKHMPPKDKEQLTDFEKEILSWWVNTGAPFDKKVSSLKPDEKTMKSLNQFKDKYSSKKTTVISRPEISKISDVQKSALEKIGWVISPISTVDNHIRVTGFNLELPVAEALNILKEYNQHVVELKLSYSGIKSADLKILSNFSELEKLWIDHNSLNDDSINELAGLKKLYYINLIETGITEKGLREIVKIPSLNTVYTYKSTLTDEQMNDLRNSFKNIKFNFGVDTMQQFESDTLFVKK
jgi:uncharacterized membrane protein